MALTEDQQRKLREMNERSLRAANQTALSTNSTIRANRERLAAHDRADAHQNLSIGAMDGGTSDLTRKAWTDQVNNETAEKHAQAERDFAATGEADLLPGMTGESDAQKQRRALGERQAELRSLGQTQGSILIGDQTDERTGRQNLIDLKNRQAHDAINEQYGALIRQGMASPFHALMAHQEQQKRYEEKTRLYGDYEKLQKEQAEKQAAAQAAAEDLHKRMGSSTFAVYTALDRLNDPDLSDSERASTLSVAAAAAQRLGEQFIENKYGADSGYKAEVVKVDGQNPATGLAAVGYEIMVKDRNGNPVVDYRSGRPLVMKLDADRARKAMEQHFGYEFQTDKDGKTTFGVAEGDNLQDGRFSFGRQDFGSMQVGDRMFGGKYSAKTREEMAKQQREQQESDDAHALNGEKIESSKSQRALAKNADARADRASERAEAESSAKIENIQAETAFTRERTAQLVKAGQEAKAAGSAEQEKFVRDTAAALVKDAQFRDRYKDETEAAKAAKKVARNLAGLDGGDETQDGGRRPSGDIIDGMDVSGARGGDGRGNATPAAYEAQNPAGGGEQNQDQATPDGKEDEAKQAQTKENAVSRILGAAWQEKNDAWMRRGQRGIGPGKRDDYVKYAAIQMRDLLNGVKKENFRNPKAGDEILLTGSWSGERARALKSLFGKNKGFVKDSEIDNVINILTKMIGE